jgi:glycosyltransferase involved in cell wall biosynthesis
MLCVSPEVSICVPVYNAEKYIYSSLKSIVKQRYDISKLKIIIINDGSTDNSLSKIEQFSKDFPKLDITVVSQENKGLNKTRYELFKLVSTEYFVFMDADDFLTKNAIRNLTSVLNENSDMVLSRMK